ncbi:hypothetical protein IPG41_05495 [Candidatus Peregrinibacteria bacterium]|nr:MAG: hypothetical protein IPG41_05495 [Candidatus Peregrinibacteria bacterium]
MKKLLFILGTFSLLGLTACGLLSDSIDCTPPDGTYAQSVNHEWQGINYALPYCWSTEEKLAHDEPFQKDTLTLTKGDDSLWVEISIGSGGSPTEKITPTRNDHKGYSVFDYAGYFYVQTNAPEEDEVQLILDSFQFTTQ